MKTRIPPEIDQLIWSVIDNGDPAAVEQFGNRYPEYRGELLKRLNFERSFKASRPNAPQAKYFQPRRSQFSFNRPRWAYAVAGVALAAVGVASFSAVMKLTQPKPVALANSVEPVNTSFVVPGTATTKLDPQYYDLKPENPIPDPDRVKKIEQTDPWMMPIDVKMERVDLLTALTAICQQGGLRAEIAPNMPTFDIGLQYSGRTALQILQELGKKYEFTVLDQGKGHILIVPEVEFSGMPDQDLPLDQGVEVPHSSGPNDETTR